MRAWHKRQADNPRSSWPGEKRGKAGTCTLLQQRESAGRWRESQYAGHPSLRSTFGESRFTAEYAGVQASGGVWTVGFNSCSELQAQGQAASQPDGHALHGQQAGCLGAYSAPERIDQVRWETDEKKHQLTRP